MTFYAGVANTGSVVCYGISGVTGTTAYPASITVNTGSLPADAVWAPPRRAPRPVPEHLGTGTTEHYILTCPITDTPTTWEVGSYPVKFTGQPGSAGGSRRDSGTLTPDRVQRHPGLYRTRGGGTSPSFYEGATQHLQLWYASETHASGGPVPEFDCHDLRHPARRLQPELRHIDSSSPACTQSTSGSGTTEEYILTCALSATPTNSDDAAATRSDLHGHDRRSRPRHIGHPHGERLRHRPDLHGAGRRRDLHLVDRRHGLDLLGRLLQQRVLLGQPRQLPGVDHPQLRHPAVARHRGHLDVQLPGLHPVDLGLGPDRGVHPDLPGGRHPRQHETGVYHTTFLATREPTVATNAVSGTWTLTVAQPAPSWATSGTTDGNYFSAIKGVPFCYDLEVSAGQVGPTGTNPGSTASLPLTSLTAGATPANVSNYSIQNVNLATGTAQICGTNNNTVASAPVIMAPVATNSGGSATDSIPLWSQNECTWSSSGATVSMFDANQDLEQAGSQSAFGQPITNGVTGGTTLDKPTCPGGVGVSASGGLGDAWTMNTANPLPTPTDSNPSAALGDLPSSNLDLTSATNGAVGGCYGATNILASTSTSAFGTSTASMTLPSRWVNGGNCAYGTPRVELGRRQHRHAGPARADR